MVTVPKSLELEFDMERRTPEGQVSMNCKPSDCLLRGALYSSSVWCSVWCLLREGVVVVYCCGDHDRMRSLEYKSLKIGFLWFELMTTSIA